MIPSIPSYQAEVVRPSTLLQPFRNGNDDVRLREILEQRETVHVISTLIAAASLRLHSYIFAPPPRHINNIPTKKESCSWHCEQQSRAIITKPPQDIYILKRPSLSKWATPKPARRRRTLRSGRWRNWLKVWKRPEEMEPLWFLW